jgi:hypothetical protein
MLSQIHDYQNVMNPAGVVAVKNSNGATDKTVICVIQ